MKKMIFLAAFTFTGIMVFAQDESLKKGDLKINVGLGLGSYIKDAGEKTTFLPLTGSLEYAVDDNTTVGPVVGYTATEYRDYYPSLDIDDTYKYSHLLIGAKANYYFDVDPKYNVYVGGLLGYNVVSVKVVSKSSYTASSSNYTASASAFLYGVQVGGRYKFTPKLAAFAELGYGIAVLNLGLTFSFSKK